MRFHPAPALLALALLLCIPTASTQESQAALNVQNADIRAFIQDIARATGTTFIVDPRVQGTVTLSSDGPMSQSELLGILVATLRANGLIAVPSGRGVYRVVPDDNAAQQPGAIGGSSFGFATEVIRLRHVDARSAVETVKPLLGRGGVALATPQGNSLLVADYADNLRRLRTLIAQIDQDRSAVEAISLRNSSAREIAAVVNNLYGSGTRGSMLSVVPVESSNAVLLRGDAAMVTKIRRVVEDLDRRAESSGDVRVVKLQHASADQLFPVLQQLLGQTGGAGTAAALPVAAAAQLQARGPFGDAASNSDAGASNAVADPGPLAAALTLSPGRRATIARYPGANAILINADPDTQRMLVDVIAQLDTRREQVLVEALVVEMSDTATQRLGAQLLLAGKQGSNIPFLVNQSRTGSGVGILEVAGAAAAIADGRETAGVVGQAVQSLLRLNGGLAGFLGESSDALFGLIIDAVKNDSGSNLLSTPSILTLDNEEARILVGQEVPITTGEVLGDGNSNPFRTIQRKDVGIQLVVKPQINAGGGVTLALRQEVSSVAGTVGGRSDELILNKREIQTRAVIDDGAIVVLGGLLDQANSKSVEKIPLLGDIPVIGGLFRSTGRSRSKTNLMVFIRPTIVRDRTEAQRLTAPRFEYMRQSQERAGGAADLDALIRDYFRTAPPVAPPAVLTLPAPTQSPVTPRVVPSTPTRTRPTP